MNIAETMTFDERYACIAFVNHISSLVFEAGISHSSRTPEEVKINEMANEAHKMIDGLRHLELDDEVLRKAAKLAYNAALEMDSAAILARGSIGMRYFNLPDL
jgi:hypothetical protein